MPASSEPALHVAGVREMDPVTLYRLLRLRVDVFVVEQQCPYPEIDGRDLEPDAQMLWVEQDGEVLATARLLRDGDDARIGRVVADPGARGGGHAARLMREAVRLSSPRTVRLDAQVRVADWYARFGFRVDGDEYLEDGIPHVPMIARDQAQGS